MERNDSFNAGSAGQTGSTGGTTGGSTGGYGSTSGGEFGTTGGAASGAGFGGSSVGSAAGSQGLGGTTGAAGATSGSRVDAAKDKLNQGLGTVKEKASNLSATLADRLEAGAEKLRQRGQTSPLVGTDGQTMSAGQSDQLNALSNRLAGGMQGTADFLRNGDLKGSVEQQVRENPARTLLIAVGVGYLLGKALKK